MLRLYLLLSPEKRIDLPETIREDLTSFLRAIEPELSSQLLNQLEIKGIHASEVLQTIRTIYGIAEG